MEVSTGGFACTGYTMSSGAGAEDVWLVRTAEDGSAQWSQTYGGTDGDWARSVQEVATGGFIIAGETFSFGAGSTDYYLLLVSADGTLVWNQTYGGLLSDSSRSGIAVSGGGYIIGGYTTSFGAGGYDIWLVRTDADGNHLWNQTYGGASEDFGITVLEPSTGGFALLGYTASFGAGLSDIWLVRTDHNGNLLWSRTYGGPDYEYGISIIEVSTGGYAIIGYTESFGAGDKDLWLIRTDTDGNHLWNQTYGGVDDDRGWSVVEVATGGFALGGYTLSYGAGWSDAWVIRTDADGNHLWNQTFGGAFHDRCHSIVQVSNGGFALLGDTTNFGAGGADFWLIRLTEPGLSFPIDPLLFMLIILFIIIIVVAIIVLRRRRKKPQKRKRKK